MTQADRVKAAIAKMGAKHCLHIRYKPQPVATFQGSRILEEARRKRILRDSHAQPV